MRVIRLFVLGICVTGGVLLAPGPSFAHDLNAKVEVGEKSVRVEAYFEEVLPAEFANAAVTNAAGTEVAAGKTDEHGVWSFARPEPGEYLLTVKCIGHTATVPFSVSGERESPPVVYTGWRLNKTLGLAIGLVGLLGLSAMYWFIRKRRE